MELTEILETIESRMIKRIRLGTFDIDGILRSKYVSREKFESAATGGLGFWAGVGLIIAGQHCKRDTCCSAGLCDPPYAIWPVANATEQADDDEPRP